MPLRLELQARDVTLVEGRPAPDSVPARMFSIEYDVQLQYTLVFDGRTVIVPSEHIHDLFAKVAQHSSAEWKFSRDPGIRSTFAPLSRITQTINSTPSYQLFLAGFQIAEAIGLLSLEEVHEDAIKDSFRYLVGNLAWDFGKKGRLFFLPDGYVDDPEVRKELMANGKLFQANLWSRTADAESHVAEKLFVPYATPIGFNTRTETRAEEVWQRINHLVSQQRGGM